VLVPRSYFDRATTLEREALEALNDPAHYPLLAPLGRLDHVVFQLGLFPTFTPYKTWALVQKPGAYYVRRVVWNRQGDYARGRSSAPSLYGSEAKLPAEAAREMRAALMALTLPLGAVETDESGRDGDTHALTITRFPAEIALSYWESGPPGWETLAQWHARAVERFEAHLPPTTFDVERDQQR
jgi:hypothetical protein